MGKKLDILFGRSFKTSKFKAAVNMAVARLAVLKNQRQARCSIARSDVVEFLNNSNRDRALLRVEQVIKEQNMLDVFVLVEGYCHLLMERVKLIQQEKNCPEELKEAVSSLIFAATRCGEFPELQEIRAIFTSRFGKEFAARAIELRNNCGVNPKIIQKLSTRMPSVEDKMKVLEDIALENNIHLSNEVEETVSCAAVDFVDNNKPKQSSLALLENKMLRDDDVEKDEDISDLMKMTSKYKDAADAAQAAFESAAYAAVAARAAVQLSRSDPTSPNFGPGKCTAVIDPTKCCTAEIDRTGGKLHPSHVKTELEFEKIIHPVQNYIFSETRDQYGGMENVKKIDASCDEAGPAPFKVRDVVFHQNYDLGTRNGDRMENAKKIGASWDKVGPAPFKVRDVVFRRNYDFSETRDQNRMENAKKIGASCDEVGPVPFKVRDVVFRGSDHEDDEARGRGNNKRFPLRNEVGFRTESSSSNNRKPVSVRTRRTHGR